MATRSSALAWRVPGTGEPVGCRLWGRAESGTLQRLSSGSIVCCSVVKHNTGVTEQLFLPKCLNLTRGLSNSFVLKVFSATLLTPTV